MSDNIFNDAFKALEALNEDAFNANKDGLDELKDFLDDAEKEDEDSLFVIDSEATDTSEIKKSYVGDGIIQCDVCKSMVYKPIGEIEVDEESGLANIDEECPYCHTVDGFTVIGKVAPFEEEKVDIEVKDKKSIKKDDEEDEEIDEETLTESKISENIIGSIAGGIAGGSLAGPIGGLAGAAIGNKLTEDDEYYDDDEEDEEEDYYDDEDEKYNLVGQDGNAFALMGYTARALRNEGLGNLCDEMRKKATSGDYNNLIAVCDKYIQMANAAARGDMKDLTESLGSDISEYQKWVDYDMKKYGHISAKTFSEIKKAGLSVTKDQYGEYEVIADRKDSDLKESLDALSLDTGDQVIDVKTKSISKSGEMLEPLTDEDKEEIEANSIEEKPNEEEFSEEDVEEVDEKELDTQVESYLRNKYSNVKSYITECVRSKGNKLIVEGTIKFKNGHTKQTSFVFEAKNIDKKHNVMFEGYNKHIGTKFNLTGLVENKKLNSIKLTSK